LIAPPRPQLKGAKVNTTAEELTTRQNVVPIWRPPANKHCGFAQAGERADIQARWTGGSYKGEWCLTSVGETEDQALTYTQAEELAKTLAQMKFVLQGTQGV